MKSAVSTASEAIGSSLTSAQPTTGAALPDLDSRTQIHDLVVHFYREIVFDEFLDHVFEDVAQVDWNSHIPRLIDYWCRVLLGHPGYDGMILAPHQEVHEMESFTAEHFDKWFALWVQSIDERWSGPLADKAKSHAEHMAGVMSRKFTSEDWSPEA
ncbi:MAG: group III truncated hemoglobin [Microthrixaceae bacterium]